MTGESAPPPFDRHTGWGYAALTPIIFGTTYVLTTEFLPPVAGCPDALAADRAGVDHRQPDSAALDGSLLRPLGALRLGLFPLLFIAAYRLPGGVAAVINSLSPLLVVVISVPLLGTGFARFRLSPASWVRVSHCWCCDRTPGWMSSA